MYTYTRTRARARVHTHTHTLSLSLSLSHTHTHTHHLPPPSCSALALALAGLGARRRRGGGRRQGGGGGGGVDVGEKGRALANGSKGHDVEVLQRLTPDCVALIRVRTRGSFANCRAWSKALMIVGLFYNDSRSLLQ